MTPRRRPAGRPAATVAEREGGITIVEVAVAMTLAVILSVGLMQVMLSGLRQVRESRLTQQATQLALEGVEYARSLTYAELAVTPEVSSGDPLLIPTGRLLDGSVIGLGADEPLVEVSSGHESGIVPYHSQEILDGVTFDIHNYVTEPEYGLRRIVVLVEWEMAGVARSQHTSALISAVSTE